MVVLKKIKAATLMETLIATVLIVVVFMIASLTLNNVFSNTTQRDKKVVDVRLKELHYFYLHQQIEIPYDENFMGWQINFTKEKDNTIEIEAIHTDTKKVITRAIHAIN